MLVALRHAANIFAATLANARFASYYLLTGGA